MAEKAAPTRKKAGATAGRAGRQTAGAVAKSKEAVEREAQQVGVRAALREAPYASLGLGRVVADAVRDVESDSLPERLRRTPGAVVSKVSKQGPNLKAGYVALAARGRGEQLKTAGKRSASGAAERARSLVGRSRSPRSKAN
jgi:hypothetical protein